MIWNRKQKQQTTCKQPLEWWIYATPFNSYTRKIGFERNGASPATNLTARHCLPLMGRYSCKLISPFWLDNRDVQGRNEVRWRLGQETSLAW